MPKGPQGQKRPADPNQLAKLIVGIATGQAEDLKELRGRAGGLSGGRVRAEKLAPERRQEIAQSGAAARWSKKERGRDNP